MINLEGYYELITKLDYVLSRDRRLGYKENCSGKGFLDEFMLMNFSLDTFKSKLKDYQNELEGINDDYLRACSDYIKIYEENVNGLYEVFESAKKNIIGIVDEFKISEQEKELLKNQLSNSNFYFNLWDIRSFDDLAIDDADNTAYMKSQKGYAWQGVDYHNKVVVCPRGLALFIANPHLAEFLVIHELNHILIMHYDSQWYDDYPPSKKPLEIMAVLFEEYYAKKQGLEEYHKVLNDTRAEKFKQYYLEATQEMNAEDVINLEATWEKIKKDFWKTTSL